MICKLCFQVKCLFMCFVMTLLFISLLNAQNSNRDNKNGLRCDQQQTYAYMYSFGPFVIDLWPDGPTKESGLTGDEKIDERGGVSNVTQPTLTVYPAYKPTGMAIMACPGGGYTYLEINTEGHDMAHWFNSLGITYAVLKYRMPNGRSHIPADDARQALKILRQRATEWGIDPFKVGIMGASAGGHLASTVATHFNDESDRPDFQILFYPVTKMDSSLGRHLIGDNQTQEKLDYYSTVKHVTEQTPPAFILFSADDRRVACEHALEYFKALCEKNVEASIHGYPMGAHGWGFRDQFPYKRQWTGELEKWLYEWNTARNSNNK